MNPLVTIGLVSFNRPAGVRRALASAVAQTYAHLEILVSDSSTDPTVADVLSEFSRSDARVRIFHHPTDAGATHNFNFVHAQARGDFFLWLADDDWLEPAAVRLLQQALAARPEAAGANGAVQFHQGDALAMNCAAQSAEGRTPARRVLSYCRGIMHNSLFFGLYRRTALAGLVLANEFAQDVLFVAKLAARGAIVAIPECTIHRSLGGASTTAAGQIKQLQLDHAAPKNDLRAYGRMLFCGLWRDRRQLPEFSFGQILGLSLLGPGSMWYRSLVPASARAVLKRWVLGPS